MQSTSTEQLNQAHSMQEEHQVGQFINVRRGEFLINQVLELDEVQEAGLKIVAIHQGAMQCQSSVGHNFKIHSPALILAGSQNRFLLNNQYSACQSLRYTAIQISPDWLEQQQLSLPDSFYHPKNTEIRHFAAPASILAIANQIFMHPTHSSLHQLYIGAKVTEMTALCLHHYLQHDDTPIKSIQLRQRDIDSLNEVKKILMQDIEQAPSLDFLARQLGMNTRKLTQGFRQLFGTSIYGWLQEYRLETAFQLLTTTDANISTIAYQMGYTPAHFSVAFRKRFNLSPSDVKKS